MFVWSLGVSIRGAVGVLLCCWVWLFGFVYVDAYWICLMYWLIVLLYLGCIYVNCGCGCL